MRAQPVNKPVFEFGIPIWTLANEANLLNDGIPESIRFIEKDGEVFFPLFSDCDLADRFIEESPLDGAVALRINGVGTLRGLFRDVRSTTDRIAIDGSTNPNHLWRTASIEDAIAAIDAES